MWFVAVPLVSIAFMVGWYYLRRRSIMSGDSPNAFTNEHAFDFREGRQSPGPTTSKEAGSGAGTTAGGGGGGGGGVVTASVLVEPPHKEKDREERKKEDEEPDFNTPILNPGHDDKEVDSVPDRSDDQPDSTFTGKAGMLVGGKGDKADRTLLNGGPDKMADAQKVYEAESEDSCMVNCIYYTMECCTCAIL